MKTHQGMNQLSGAHKYGILLLGVLLQAVVFFQNRSLRLDEANLARNIVDRTYLQLLESLDHGQFAPPLYSCWVKLCADIFGAHEFALRLPSLVAGITALFLLLALLKKLQIKKIVAVYIFLLVALSPVVLRYTSELKQYALDLACAEFFLLWALNTPKGITSWQQSWKWAVLGGLAIWLSMPIIFILATIGLMFFWQAIKLKTTVIFKLIPLGGTYLLSFMIYFFSLLYKDSREVFLQNYHEIYYFKFFTIEASAWKQNIVLLDQTFRLMVDQTALSLIWAICSFLGAILLLTRTKKRVAFLLLMPILFCFLASSLELYSLTERLILFLIPFFLLVIGLGLSWLWSRIPKPWVYLLCIPMLIGLVNKNGYKYLWTKMEMEDAKSLMKYLEANRKDNELIYVHWDAKPAFHFYNHQYLNAWQFDNYIESEDWAESFATQLQAQVGQEEHFWVFITHYYPPELVRLQVQRIEAFAVREDELEAADAYLYKFKKVR